MGLEEGIGTNHSANPFPETLYLGDAAPPRAPHTPPHLPHLVSSCAAAPPICTCPLAYTEPQVRPSFFTREEFKTAANAITQTGYTPEHRSNVEDLLGVSVVCLSRTLPAIHSPEQLRNVENVCCVLRICAGLARLICWASLPACLFPDLQAMGQQIIDGVAAGRGLPAQQVRSAMDSGPLLPEAALRCKLIDGILYRDEVGVVKAS